MDSPTFCVTWVAVTSGEKQVFHATDAPRKQRRNGAENIACLKTHKSYSILQDIIVLIPDILVGLFIHTVLLFQQQLFASEQWRRYYTR